MAGAPKGNKNALKHGLFAKRVVQGEVMDDAAAAALRAPVQGQGAQESLLRAIRYLESVMDELRERLKAAEGTEEFTRLANSLALAATALFNGHRTVAYLIGGLNPVEDAMKELEGLGFEED